MMDARPWLPSIDCVLIKKGEPDIVGPGVRSANIFIADKGMCGYLVTDIYVDLSRCLL